MPSYGALSSNSGGLLPGALPFGSGAHARIDCFAFCALGVVAVFFMSLLGLMGWKVVGSLVRSATETPELRSAAYDSYIQML